MSENPQEQAPAETDGEAYVETTGEGSEVVGVTSDPSGLDDTQDIEVSEGAFVEVGAEEKYAEPPVEDPESDDKPVWNTATHGPVGPAKAHRYRVI